MMIKGQPNGPFQKENHQIMHPQLINMNLQEGTIIKDI
jgi:hypothetical protein